MAFQSWFRQCVHTVGKTQKIVDQVSKTENGLRTPLLHYKGKNMYFNAMTNLK